MLNPNRTRKVAITILPMDMLEVSPTLLGSSHALIKLGTGANRIVKIANFELVQFWQECLGKGI